MNNFTNELSFDGVEVPVQNRIGEEATASATSSTA